MRAALLLYILLSAGICFPQLSDQLKIQKLDSLFSALEKNNMSMGSISIYKNGREFYSKTYGISNDKNHQKLLSGDKTVYRIGSISKILTAFLIIKLAEENKLELKQDIGRFFPDLKHAKNISIEQLLAHKSLLPVYHKVDDLEKLRRAKTEAEFIAIVNKREQNADTSKFRYNNLNYTLLGLIVEKVTGKSYNEALEVYLKELPGHRLYGTYHLLDHQKNEANSFHLEKEVWKEDYEITESPLSDGSGFLLSNAGTLNEFMENLFAYKLISRESLETMLPKNGMFGYGLMKSNFYEHRGFGHTGRIEGFTAACSYFPAEQIGVTFLQNGTVYPLNDIMVFVGEIMFDKPFILPGFSKRTLGEDDIAKMQGSYINKEEGYTVIVDAKKQQLRLRIVKGHSPFKMIIPTLALEKNRLLNPSQGIIFDFNSLQNSRYMQCEMKVNGAKLKLERLTNQNP
jgi:CubicO group peptidase (beta-lactamase class C family)